MFDVDFGDTGLVVWLTGLPGSGKTALAIGMHTYCREEQIPSCIIDGDELRKGLCSDLGFSAEDRRENVRRAGEVAKLWADQGYIAFVALVSPYEADRRSVRSRLAKDMFLEVHVNCPVEVCRRRDPKGMYARADRGEIPQFTGVSDPYEVPTTPDLRLDTHTENEDASLNKLRMAVFKKRSSPFRCLE